MYMLPFLRLALLSSQVSPTTDFTTRHALSEIPSGWTAVARAPAEHLIDMHIGLKQGRMDELLSTLGEVSDPSHARYRMYLSKSEVDELVAPRTESVESVQKWLDEHDVKAITRSSSGDWLHVLVPVARAEQMLNTRYNIYHHTSGSHIIRSESYALPRSLDAHIDLVQPTTFFDQFDQPNPGKMSGGMEELVRSMAILSDASKDRLAPWTCNERITPDCLRKLYKTESYVPVSKNSSIGVTGYRGEFANLFDLQKFYRRYRPDAVGSTLTVELVNGGINDQHIPGKEANLDVQYASAISYPIPNIFYSVGPSSANQNTPATVTGPYLEWLIYMLNKTMLPQTISTSYAIEEHLVMPEYANRVCNSFAELGVRGVSVLFSSGDHGVGRGTCKTKEGSPTRFRSMFPASCPYVTAVGATRQMNPEVAAKLSQGGFSELFLRPAYQARTAELYLEKLGMKYSGMFNSNGRGFPDVAAQGIDYLYVISDTTSKVSGTSASTPTFAAVIALLNDYSLSHGKPPLGFLNPWLYSMAVEGLNDITAGNNPGCDTEGFNATTGWDPVTGLGTPDFMKLQEVLRTQWSQRE